MQDVDFDGGLWAVITMAGGKKVIGEIVHPKDELELVGAINKRELVTVHNTFEFFATMMPVPPPQPGMPPGMTRIVQAMPVDNCREPAKIMTIIEGVHLFSDMKEQDRVRHKELVKQILEQLTAARFKEAGLSLAGPGDMPRGPIPGSS